MTESEKISYIAGFFDGQGYVNYNFTKDEKGRTKFYVHFYQSGYGKEVEKIKEIIESLGIKVSIYKPKRKREKQEYQICITNRKDSEKLLVMMLPYLIIKKKMVKKALKELHNYYSTC